MTDFATLHDRRAIEEVYFRYCEIIDLKDFDRLDEVFTPEAVGDYRTSNGILQDGLAPLVARLKQGMGPGSDCGPTQHNVSNLRITIHGDTAVGQAHFYAVHQGLGAYEGQIYTCWGQYDDQWFRTERGWRVHNRLYRNFLTEGPVAIIRSTRNPG